MAVVPPPVSPADPASQWLVQFSKDWLQVMFGALKPLTQRWYWEGDAATVAQAAGWATQLIEFLATPIVPIPGGATDIYIINTTVIAEPYGTPPFFNDSTSESGGVTTHTLTLHMPLALNGTNGTNGTNGNNATIRAVLTDGTDIGAVTAIDMSPALIDATQPLPYFNYNTSTSLMKLIVGTDYPVINSFDPTQFVPKLSHDPASNNLVFTQPQQIASTLPQPASMSTVPDPRCTFAGIFTAKMKEAVTAVKNAQISNSDLEKEVTAFVDILAVLFPVTLPIATVTNIAAGILAIVQSVITVTDAEWQAYQDYLYCETPTPYTDFSHADYDRFVSDVNLSGSISLGNRVILVSILQQCLDYTSVLNCPAWFPSLISATYTCDSCGDASTSWDFTAGDQGWIIGLDPNYSANIGSPYLYEGGVHGGAGFASTANTNSAGGHGPGTNDTATIYKTGLTGALVTTFTVNIAQYDIGQDCLLTFAAKGTDGNWRLFYPSGSTSEFNAFTRPGTAGGATSLVVHNVSGFAVTEIQCVCVFNQFYPAGDAPSGSLAIESIIGA